MVLIEKTKIEIDVCAATPFDAITDWCRNNSSYCYTFVPVYKSKKQRKEYEKWLQTLST